jgi:hypothetical protein
VGTAGQFVYDTFTSPYVILPLVTGGGITYLSGTKYVKETPFIANALNYAAGYVSFDLKAKIAVQIVKLIAERTTTEFVLGSLSLLGYEHFVEKTRFWPSAARRELMEEIELIRNADYRRMDEYLRNLGNAFENALPGSRMAVEDIRNALILEETDRDIIKLFETQQTATERVKKTDRMQNILVQKFQELAGTATEMSEEELKEGINRLRAALEVATNNLNPDDVKQLPD